MLFFFCIQQQFYKIHFAQILCAECCSLNFEKPMLLGIYLRTVLCILFAFSSLKIRIGGGARHEKKKTNFLFMAYEAIQIIRDTF